MDRTGQTWELHMTSDGPVVYTILAPASFILFENGVVHREYVHLAINHMTSELEELFEYSLMYWHLNDAGYYTRLG